MVDVQRMGSWPSTLDPHGMDASQHLEAVSGTLRDYIRNLTLSEPVGKNVIVTSKNSDKPELPLPTSEINADLAQLLLKLRTENDEKQMKAAVEYIKTNKSKIESKHQERIEKILKAAEAAEKAEKAGKAGKIFGWVCLAVTVVAAVAACVATGGLAVGPCVGGLDGGWHDGNAGNPGHGPNMEHN